MPFDGLTKYVFCAVVLTSAASPREGFSENREDSYEPTLLLWRISTRRHTRFFVDSVLLNCS